jgi:A/G-specific adenine glycosylase
MITIPPPRPDSVDPLFSAAAVTRLHAEMLGWYAANARDLPWRRTTNAYAILVSEVMLQQTQVRRVIPRYFSFLERFPDLETLASSALKDVLEEWSGLGYNNRAERLRRCAQAVVSARGPGGAGRAVSRPEATADPDGRAALPADLRSLQALPGLGPYTARAVLIFAQNADLAAVDANVRRVLTHELRLPHDLSVPALQSVADAVLPPGRSRDWHNALMDYGALVLTSRATGIAARARQAPFAGSRRWWRSRVVRALLADGPQTAADLGSTLSLDDERLEELLNLLERDGIVERRGDVVAVP